MTATTQTIVTVQAGAARGTSRVAPAFGPVPRLYSQARDRHGLLPVRSSLPAPRQARERRAPSQPIARLRRRNPAARTLRPTAGPFVSRVRARCNPNLMKGQ